MSAAPSATGKIVGQRNQNQLAEMKVALDPETEKRIRRAVKPGDPWALDKLTPINPCQSSNVFSRMA